jgi:hypothetical protein
MRMLSHVATCRPQRHRSSESSGFRKLPSSSSGFRATSAAAHRRFGVPQIAESPPHRLVVLSASGRSPGRILARPPAE